MRKVLNRLFCLPLIVWFFHIIFRVAVIITMPILIIAKLLFFMLLKPYKNDEQLNKERSELTEKQIEDIVMRWSAEHSDKIKSIDRKRFENKKYKFTWLELIIISYNPKAKCLKLCIGGPAQLTVTIDRNDKNLNVEYDTNNGTHNYNINAIELDCLLNAYLNGDYYMIQRYIDDNKIIDEHLYIKNPQGTYTTNSYDLALAVERKTIHQKKNKLYISLRGVSPCIRN